MPPTLGNGKICYIEIPAIDIACSADFYRRVFGWHIRQRDSGHTAFDDTTGEVSGTLGTRARACIRARPSDLRNGEQRARHS